MMGILLTGVPGRRENKCQHMAPRSRTRMYIKQHKLLDMFIIQH